jgi:2-polyprenyl-3-methyl-5-hydroxy-6-metoxy-1,4-benzoquinol methylase
MLLESIRTRPCPQCFVCGSRGHAIYRGLDDLLFGSPGTWSVSRCSNVRCGLLWLDPQPVEEDIGLAYANYFTHAAAADGPSLPREIFRQVRASVLRARLGYRGAVSGFAWRLLAQLGRLYPGGTEALAASAMFVAAPTESSSLLDVGCGAGTFMATMRDLGWHVSGVETDPRAVERARERGLDVRHAGLEQAGFASASFDVITMAHVIEHVHDPARLLAECRRILKPRGTLTILTPNSSSWGHRHFGHNWMPLDPPRHLRLHNKENLSRLVESAGLQPVHVVTLAINANGVWSKSAEIRRARSDGRSTIQSPRSVLSGVAPQLAERLRLTVDSDAGEDLLVIATRAA